MKRTPYPVLEKLCEDLNRENEELLAKLETLGLAYEKGLAKYEELLLHHGDFKKKHDALVVALRKARDMLRVP